MRFQIDLTKDELHAALVKYIEAELGVSINDYELRIEVKSKQNYKSEWEEADYRATVTRTR
jgi:hypothetical protein